MQEPGERVILFAKENIKEDEINVFDKLFYIQKLFKAAYHQIFPLSFARSACAPAAAAAYSQLFSLVLDAHTKYYIPLYGGRRR
jgi:hypothetical protein